MWKTQHTVYGTTKWIQYLNLNATIFIFGLNLIYAVKTQASLEIDVIDLFTNLAIERKLLSTGWLGWF